jgi:hypothetical protein
MSFTIRLIGSLIGCSRHPPTPRDTQLKEFHHNQVHQKDRLQSEIARSVNTRDSHMARDKHKSITNRNQGIMVPSEVRSLNMASPGYPNTTEKQDSILKSHIMKMIENPTEDINNSRNEI